MLHNLVSCHPDRKHWAKGLCRTCYNNKKIWLKYKTDPEYHKKLNMIKWSYRKRNPERNRLSLMKTRLKAYGMTIEMYEDLFEKQQGKCAICFKEGVRLLTSGNPLCVDHDHITGKVRGLLCGPCNSHLGILEKVEWRVKAEAYLKTGGNTY